MHTHCIFHYSYSINWYRSQADGRHSKKATPIERIRRLQRTTSDVSTSTTPLWSEEAAELGRAPHHRLSTAYNFEKNKQTKNCPFHRHLNEFSTRKKWNLRVGRVGDTDDQHSVAFQMETPHRFVSSSSVQIPHFQALQNISEMFIKSIS